MSGGAGTEAEDRPAGPASGGGGADGDGAEGDGNADPGGRSSKAEVADRERGERRYDETYGRAAGERFGGADYPHAYGAPEGVNWRRALRAYVSGHDRGWEADRKYAVAAGAGPDAASPGREAEPERHGAPEIPDAEAGEATARTERGTPFGVGVADPGEMTFHRSASTWRERLPEAPRMPRHAGRELDGRRGRGRQA